MTETQGVLRVRAIRVYQAGGVGTLDVADLLEPTSARTRKSPLDPKVEGTLSRRG